MLPPCSHPILGPSGTSDQKGEQFDAIMTVTDKFTKGVKFLKGRKDYGSKAWAERFYERIVTTWGFPKTLITDQDKRFIANIWKELFHKAGTHCINTTAWHPAADGQSERTNQSLEITLRFYVDGRQEDWVKYLPVVESVFNNSTSAATGYSPNEMMYGMKTRTVLDLIADPLNQRSSSADELAEDREVIRKEATDAIAVAQKLMATNHNSGHDEPNFNSGYAYISLKGGGYTLPSIKKKKLAAQRIGPFKILEKVGKGRSMILDLPAHYKINRAISMIHLEPAPHPDEDPFGRRRCDFSEPVVGSHDDEDAEWEIEALIDKRTIGRGKIQYLARWKGWGDEYDQWIDKKNLLNPKELIEDYEGISGMLKC